jgi:CheY-like chemotaxis protein
MLVIDTLMWPKPTNRRPPARALARRQKGRSSVRKTPRRVLIVEDEALVAMELRGLLEEAGYEIVGWASSAPAAVAESRRFAPDLVLMDITLEEGGDGVAAADRIRQELGIPSVFVSANSDRATIERARNVGVAYVRKPYDSQQLLTTVASVFEA